MAVRGERDTSGLTEDEGRLLGELAERIGESRLRVAGIWNGKSDDGQKSRPRGAHPGETAVLSRKVRILKDIEPYTGLDKNVYGPFRIGEERSLPMPEAEWLLKSRLAEPL
jgi:hypothetical protein